MVELAKQFLGKKCVFSMFNSTQVSGILKEISGNAVLVEENGVCEAVNLDFVTRIREIPGKEEKEISRRGGMTCADSMGRRKRPDDFADL